MWGDATGPIRALVWNPNYATEGAAAWDKVKAKYEQIEKAVQNN